ncbi:unnamed protein product [Peronospora belbahrii]|uniref:Uncharacterized protein n=1 Tax=Peronospora belbahrii TaxID=622444 RepID=A0ABN8CR79_9STRA|nr:unnamed protein product [Peronospora belbahrii]
MQSSSALQPFIADSTERLATIHLPSATDSNPSCHLDRISNGRQTQWTLGGGDAVEDVFRKGTWQEEPNCSANLSGLRPARDVVLDYVANYIPTEKSTTPESWFMATVR